MLHRELNSIEEIEFVEWANDNYQANQPIDRDLWHPVIVQRCDEINLTQEMLDAWAKIPLKGITMSKVTKLDYNEAMLLLRDYKASLTEDELLALNDVASAYIANEPTNLPDSLRIKNRADRQLKSLTVENRT